MALERWLQYLSRASRDHPYLKAWDDLIARGGSLDDARRIGGDFQRLVETVVAEKKTVCRSLGATVRRRGNA